THGLALGLASLICLIRFRETQRSRWLLAGGLFLGLVVLTKLEMALAAGLATVAALLFIARAGREPREAIVPIDGAVPASPGAVQKGHPRGRFPEVGELLRDLCRAAIPLTAAAMAPSVIAVATLSRPLGWNAAWRGVFSSFLLALNPAVTAKSGFYRIVG